MDILWVATKPPWPPVDGGRLVSWATLRGLAARGHTVRLVAPRDVVSDDAAGDLEIERRMREVCEPLLVDAPARPRLVDWLRAQRARRPLSIVRHQRPAVTAAVAALCSARRPDVVHVEQLQALAAAAPARRLEVPCLLRAQNVESDLWRAIAGRRSWPFGALLRHEAGRLARAEGRAVASVEAVAALTREDAERLEELAGASSEPRRVEVVPAAVPLDETLGVGAEPGPALPGTPAVVVFGSAGWPPNLDGARWFVERAWPAVRRAAPGAVLHLFGFGALGGAVEAVVRHPAPVDSVTAFARDSVLAVPLFVASGVRMKILEAWARGVAVVATSAAASGLGTAATIGPDAALTVADDPEGLAAAIARLRDLEARRRRIEAGRTALENHAPDRVAEHLERLYERISGRDRLSID